MKLNVKKTATVTFLLFVFIFICYHLFWVIYLSDIPKNIKPSLKEVMKKYYISRINGSYWENEMEFQADKIANFSQNDRIAFFRNIMLFTCDLDTSRATVFVYKLGSDANALRLDLVNLKKSQDFNGLTILQKKVVLDWIKELEIIVQQQSMSGDNDDRAQ